MPLLGGGPPTGRDQAEGLQGTWRVRSPGLSREGVPVDPERWGAGEEPTEGLVALARGGRGRARGLHGREAGRVPGSTSEVGPAAGRAAVRAGGCAGWAEERGEEGDAHRSEVELTRWVDGSRLADSSGVSMAPLEVEGGFLAESGVAAMGIVPAFDAVEDGHPRLGLGAEAVLLDGFGLERDLERAGGKLWHGHDLVRCDGQGGGADTERVARGNGLGCEPSVGDGGGDPYLEHCTAPGSRRSSILCRDLIRRRKRRESQAALRPHRPEQDLPFSPCMARIPALPSLPISRGPLAFLFLARAVSATSGSGAGRPVGASVAAALSAGAAYLLLYDDRRLCGGSECERSSPR